MSVFKNNLKRYWLFLILLLTMVFVLFGIFFCQRTGELFHRDNTDALSNMAASLSDSLVFGNALSVEIASIPELSSLGQLDELKGTCMLDLKKVSNILSRTSEINRMVESVYIRFTRSGKVLTQETLYDLDTFYDREILDQCQADDLAIWYGCRQIATGGLSYVQPVNVLTIIRRIPFELFSADDLVVINLNIDNLLNGFSRYEQVFMISGDMVMGANGYQNKADTLRQQLLSRDFSDRKGMLALPGEYLYYQQLDSSSIYCASLVPKTQLINACLPSISILLLIYLASVFAFFLLIYLFSRITSHRSQALIQKIGDGTGNPIPAEVDPSAALDDAIDQLITSNRQMSESEKKYASLIQSTVIADIILGHIHSEQKLEEHLAYSNLQFEHPYFTGFVCLTTIDDTKLQDDATTAYSVTLFIKDLIERELSAAHRIYFHTSLDNKIYFFINHNTSFETLSALLNASLHQVNTLAQSDYDVSLLFFTGPCVDSLTKVSHSCYIASRLSESHKPSEIMNSINDSSVQHDLPAHPTVFTEQIINGFRQNSRQMVLKGMDAYFNEYLLPAQLPVDMCKNITCILANNVVNDIWLSNHELHIDEMTSYITGIYNVTTLDSLNEKTAALLMTLFDHRSAAELNSGYIGKHVPTVIDYIRNNYYKDLSIADIASCVDLNPRYLGELFKEATGNTLIQHLNMVRIDCAKRLLAETNATIREIAEKVGYNGAHTFIRHFKTLNNGITPSEYRGTPSGQ